LLKKANNSNFLKRMIYGLDADKIERKLQQIISRLKVINLRLNSLQKENQEYKQKSNNFSREIEKLQKELEQLLKSYGLSSIEEREKILWDLSEEKREKEFQIKQAQDEIKIIEEHILENAQVIGCTLTRAYLDSKIIKRRFDVLIIDEASMAQLPTIFFVAGLSSGHYVISGDFCQLPPIAVSNNKEVTTWLKRDIFTQAGIVESIKSRVYDKRLVMLKEQYRMHPDICRLINEPVYHGNLRTNELIAKNSKNIASLIPAQNEALIFCDTAKINPIITSPTYSFSRFSPYSAIISTVLAERIIEDSKKRNIDVNVGIVTPYSAQAQLISKILEDKNIDKKLVLASTIHKFQGNEKSCIIFDLVEGPPFSPGKLTKGIFTSEQGKLITVAISRAKSKFILVGNGHYIKENFNSNDAITKILIQIENFGGLIDSAAVLSPTFGKSERKDTALGKKFFAAEFTFLDENNFYQQFLKDINLAQSSILILSPFIAQKRLKSLLKPIKNTIKKKIKISIVTRHPDYQGGNSQSAKRLIESLQEIGVNVIIASSKTGIHEKFHEKICVIDESVFYHGSMNILSHSNSSESMIVIRGKKTVKELTKKLGLKEIIRKYKNATGVHSPNSIIYMIEQKLLKKIDPGSCKQCGKKLILIKEFDNLFFGCPNLLNRDCDTRIKVGKAMIVNAIKSLKIKCEQCQEGYMIYRDGRFGPFLGCDHYRSSGCRSIMHFDDEMKSNSKTEDSEEKRARNS
jgi:ssDNA-binding Zn-finger/Zn-ribbon topoisomerase 1